MEDLTIEDFNEAMSKPIVFGSHHHAKKGSKSIEFHPLNQNCTVRHNGIVMSRSNDIEDMINFYNSISI